MIPQITLDKCEYRKPQKILTLASEYCGMPAKIRVHSHRTGQSVLFRVVEPGDPLFDPDQWDGEQQIYRPVETNTKVNYLVIYHQY